MNFWAFVLWKWQMTEQKGSKILLCSQGDGKCHWILTFPCYYCGLLQTDSNSTERMSALKANDGWRLSQVMFLNQPYVIPTDRQALRLFCLKLRLHILFMSRYCRINMKWQIDRWSSETIICICVQMFKFPAWEEQRSLPSVVNPLGLEMGKYLTHKCPVYFVRQPQFNQFKSVY